MRSLNRERELRISNPVEGLKKPCYFAGAWTLSDLTIERNRSKGFVNTEKKNWQLTSLFAKFGK